MACASVARGEDKGVVDPGARLESLASGFSFTEGPAADSTGHVFFTDQANDRSHQWPTDGKL